MTESARAPLLTMTEREIGDAIAARLFGRIIEELDAQRAALAREREARAWQPIETAPLGEYLLLWAPNAGWCRAIGSTDASGMVTWWGGNVIVHKPTHWMREPSEPAKGAAE